MNILLVAINAKYIHSSLAAYSLYGYLSKEEKQHVQIKEFTVNQSEELITSELLRAKPDVLAFSCYIWNIDLVISLMETFKKTMPHVPIILGGPEASYEYESLLAAGADSIVRGEGEEPFKQLVQSFIKGEASVPQIIEPTCPIPLEDIPFAYPHGFAGLQNRIIYYETSRGCVNNCGYCLSSATKGVRFLPWERVKSDLNQFIEAKVPQVKFIDRTFNSNKNHAMIIWQYLIANDNGITNFHFEIAGDTLDADALALLATARKGLFQFEIGVQSTNAKTLECIRRKTDTGKLLANVVELKKPGNIHLHLDLIVGLPFENYDSFKQSFNRVFAVRPHKLQVGFLKLLRGSMLRENAAKFGIEYKKNAPYGVLQTNDISFDEVNHIKKIEHMVETFYGASGFESSIRLMLEQFQTPFEFFDKLAIHWESKENHLVSHKKMAMYSFLHDFAAVYLPGELRLVCELLKYDMLLQENVRTFPTWINDYYTPDNRLIDRTSGVHTFEYNIFKWMNNTTPLIKQHSQVKFDYAAKTQNLVQS